MKKNRMITSILAMVAVALCTTMYSCDKTDDDNDYENEYGHIELFNASVDTIWYSGYQYNDIYTDGIPQPIRYFFKRAIPPYSGEPVAYCYATEKPDASWIESIKKCYLGKITFSDGKTILYDVDSVNQKSPYNSLTFRGEQNALNDVYVYYIDDTDHNNATM